jgi:flavorubredoxin
MGKPFEAVKISDNVYWVGAIDWAIRDFHGYSTNRGSTYNAYLILADKITLVDTVKASFRDELMSRVASVVDPKKIDVFVSNHSEMDHTGCFPDVLREAEPDEVYASTMGVKALEQHFHAGVPVTAVKDDSRISLGNMHLRFFETRMLHWPDSMFSYLEEEQVLFSQDAFGMHLASSSRFDDEIDAHILDYESAKYYANILMPFSPLVTKLLERWSGLGLPLKLVAPDHGPVWRTGIPKIIAAYADWALRKPTMKTVVVYDTMWGSTEKMALAVADGLCAGGATPVVLPIRRSHRSDITTEVLEAGALLVGSPTINRQMFPTLADALTYLKALGPPKLIGAAFGSYGWSGEAVGYVNRILEEMKVRLVSDGLRVQYVPDEEALNECRALGGLVAERLRELVEG